MRVDVKPEILRWARERADMNTDVLVDRFPRYAEWENGEAKPTLKQLEKFASVVHAPIGYFFLSEPPEESFPIPDFRTAGGAPLRQPSPELLDTIYLCQRRQDWYREHARVERKAPLPFIRSANPADSVEEVAAYIRSTLRFDLEERRALATWSEALRRFIKLADELGVLVMVSGIVASNTRRKLDPDEFRGFALADDIAPLVFINGADTRAAQMFTLAHELAHLWLGQSALSNSRPNFLPTHEVETWCNRVAAEFLVPLAILREEYHTGENLSDALIRLARRFKVSLLVILRRIHDMGGLPRDEFRAIYDVELQRLKAIPRSSGGSFYPTQTARVSSRFARAVIASTLEGRTSFTESFRLLGFRKTGTFDKLARQLGIIS